MKYNSNATRRFLLSALTIAISSVSVQTLAQQEALEEITITGSRIRDTGMTSPVPVTSVNAAELANMAPGNIIESLSQLPLFLNNEQPQTQFNFAGSGGASNLNLRGIGTQRTLVLLNGRRVVPSSRLNTVDINLFPDAMIRSVETVTGGASAAYGTDAVAGVANFILDTDFEGIAANVQGGQTSRGDAETVEGSFSFGADVGDSTHVLLSFGGYRQDGIDGYKGRDWYKGWGTVTNPDWQAAILDGSCVANQPCAAGPQLIRAPQVVSTEYTFGGLTVSPVPALNNLMFLSDGSVSPFRFSDLAAVGFGTRSQSIANQYGGGSGDNFEGDRGGEGGLTPNMDRDNLFAYIDHEVSDTLTVYAQGMYGNSSTNAPAFSSVQLAGWAPTVFVDNAFLPDSLRQAMIANGQESIGLSSLRSTADLGQARFEQENRMNAATVGFTWDVGADWTVEGYYQYGETNQRIRQFDFPRVDRIFLALDSVVNPADGSIVCRAALFNPAQYGDCVPLNLFGAGRASQQGLDYALGRSDGTNTKVQVADIDQNVVDISASGIITEGWAGPISAAVGAAYREDAMVQVVLDPTNPGNLSTNVAVPRNDPTQGIQGIPGAFAGGVTGFQFSGAQNFNGKITVSEYFGELLVPLVTDLPLVQQLNTNIAARWADYSGSGGVWSYKLGFDWEVTDDLRLRATGSRDVRAGSLSERFDAQNQGASAEDPFLTGSPSYAFTQTIGGNPNIDPEEADTYTVGFVYQPNWLPGLSVSADWYEITTEGLIAQLGVQNIVNQCFQGSQSQCANISRGADGRITSVFNGYQNIGEAVVSGADLELSYRTDFNLFGGLAGGGESLLLRAFYSYVDENSQNTEPGNRATQIERAGWVGGGLPRNKLTSQFTYMNGPLTAFVQGRYIGAGKHSNQISGVNAVEGIHIDDNTVSSVFYTDLNVSWLFETGTAGEVELFANVTNLFDRDPPVHGSFFNFFGSTQVIEALHDTLGRRYTGGVRVRF